MTEQLYPHYKTTKYRKYGKFLKALDEKPEILEFILSNLYKSSDNEIFVKAVDMRKSLGPLFDTMDESAIKNGLEFSLFMHGIFLSSTKTKEINPETDREYILLKLRLAKTGDKLSENLTSYIEPYIIDTDIDISDLAKYEDVPDKIKNILENKIRKGEWPEHYRWYVYRMYKKDPLKRETLPYIVRNIIRQKKVIYDTELRNLIKETGYSIESGGLDVTLRVLQIVTEEIKVIGVRGLKKIEWIGE